MEYNKSKYHIPVLLNKVVEYLQASRARLIVDVTLGDGGYSEAILKAMPNEGQVIGIDRDETAIRRATERLSWCSERLIALRGNFAEIAELLAAKGIHSVDGVVADLGVSTLQIVDPGRGFMFSGSGPLLMQMGSDAEFTAEQVVNDFPEEELAEIIKKFGEERAAKRIARAIAKARARRRIADTETLAKIVKSVVPERTNIKTLARVFQGIRIFVNKELESLELFLPQAVELMRQGSRLVIVSYHSLEDRIVKQFMARSENPCICPPGMPMCVCGKKATLKRIGKLIKPSVEEIMENPRSRSAKMRVAEKL